MDTVTVLTDFGGKDPYVGIMKGVMLAVNPRLAIVDITHEVEAQDVREACFLIGEYYPYFPEGTVHLCVVDPTVGSARKPLVVSKGGHSFVGPDNGLFSLLFAAGDASAHEIVDRRFMREPVSATFHGRDIFAPAAAHLSAGTDPSEFGPAVEGPVMLPALFPLLSGGVMEGEIVRFDRFGNGISNIPFGAFKAFTGGAPYLVELCGLSFPALSRSYYDGRHTCVVGSSGYLEFGLFKGDLAEELSLKKGERVKVTRR